MRAWSLVWVETLDVETRTEENYRSYLRNRILPRRGYTALGDITSVAVTIWLKDLRKRYAASTVAGIRTVFSMMLDDAVDQRLISTNPVHRRRRRGRRRDHSPTRAEKVFAMPEHVIRIAEKATTLGGPSAGLLVITAAWTGCRWGESWRACNAITSTSPPSPARSCSPAHSAADYDAAPSTAACSAPPSMANLRKGTHPIRPGLTFHGLRHSRKTWLIADHIPEIAQAPRSSSSTGCEPGPVSGASVTS